MPRKTDGLPFEVHRSPSQDEEGRSVLYATPQSDRTREFRELESMVEMKNALRKGELQSSLYAFMDECSFWLADGYRIQSPLGTFSLRLGMKRKVTSPNEVRHDDVEFKGIEFHPSADFLRAIRRRIGNSGFRYVRKADSTLLIRNEEEMQKALYQSIHPEGDYTTVPSFMFHSGLSKYAATKMLKRWCEGNKPLLRSRRVGHSVIYELV